jgi:hypothetical protein
MHDDSIKKRCNHRSVTVKGKPFPDLPEGHRITIEAIKCRDLTSSTKTFPSDL